MFTLDWTNKESMQLINEYRNHPILWDRNVNGYKNKMKRIDAWTDIANKFGCSKSEVERKMNVLLTQYRREKHKIMMRYYDHTGDPYRSTWYAFQEFAFLEDYKARQQGREVGSYPLKPVAFSSLFGRNDKHLLVEQNYPPQLLHYDSPLTNPEASMSATAEAVERSIPEVPDQSLSEQQMVVIHNEEEPLISQNILASGQNQRVSSPSVSVEIHEPSMRTRSTTCKLNSRRRYEISEESADFNVPKTLKRKKRKDLKNSKKLKSNLKSLATTVLTQDDSDHIGANVTLKLRNMDRSQRIIAEKLISDVLFYGQINELSATARVLPAKEKPS